MAISSKKIAGHDSLAKAFNRDEPRVNWHDQTLWFVREKRDRAARQLPEWEQLREQASQIKARILGELHKYLTTFEARARDNGITVHWAETPEEHNRIVTEIIQRHHVKRVVKSKSMLTEECHLNDHLQAQGIEVIDTDLGERIVQLAQEPPSHIVLPCIHWKKEEIGDLFHHHLGTPKGASDPQLLTYAARRHLREYLVTSKVAISGVNFAIAETGEIVICTNEGNADLAIQRADVHIACMGIEKVIPSRKDLAVFLRLLARSATGQPITTYSSHYHKPLEGRERHIVLLDNGRSKRLGSEAFRDALKCIRCGACFNTCPVYRRSGGQSYNTVVAGPIGSILAPAVDLKKHADLPFASTLCGSCSNACPVKIDIHGQLYQWRQKIVREGQVTFKKRTGIKVLNLVLSSPALFRISGKLARWMMKYFPVLVRNRFNTWYNQRDLPTPPETSFTTWYIKNRRKK